MEVGQTGKGSQQTACRATPLTSGLYAPDLGRNLILQFKVKVPELWQVSVSVCIIIYNYYKIINKINWLIKELILVNVNNTFFLFIIWSQRKKWNALYSTVRPKSQYKIQAWIYLAQEQWCGCWRKTSGSTFLCLFLSHKEPEVTKDEKMSLRLEVGSRHATS